MADTPSLCDSQGNMDKQPAFDGGQRIMRPPDTMTEELAADLGFCVTYLSPQQCRELLCGLSDAQVQSVVYNRAICNPDDQWTKSIQGKYVADMKVRNRQVTCFQNIVESVKGALQPWMGIFVYSPDQFNEVEHKLMTFILPSIDNIGVYATYSDYSQTKRNGLTALTEIGSLFLGAPMFHSTSKGQALLKYDGLSRAVANILHSAANPLQRQQMLDHGTNEDLISLVDRSKQVGLFPCLEKAISSEPAPVPYHLPEVQPQQQYQSNAPQSQGHLPQLQPRPRQKQEQQQQQEEQKSSIKRKRTVKTAKPAKKAKTNSCTQQGSTNVGTQQQTEQEVTSQEEKEHRAITRIKEVIQQDHQQDHQHRGEGQNTPVQQMVEPKKEQQPAAPAIQENTQPANFNDAIDDISNQMFHAHATKDARIQVLYAPSVCRSIEGWCSLVAMRTKAVADANPGGESDVFPKTQQNALWVLFWIVECCALDPMGTPLSREVSRQLGWAPIIQAVWNCVKDTAPREMGKLLRSIDNNGVSIEVKLDALLQSLHQKGVAGFERLTYVLDEMRQTASKA